MLKDKREIRDKILKGLKLTRQKLIKTKKALN